MCDGLKRSVPKAIVHNQVAEAKRSLLAPLYTEAGSLSEEALQAMLGGTRPLATAARCAPPRAPRCRAAARAESPEVAERRRVCAERLALLRKAREEVAAVQV